MEPPSGRRLPKASAPAKVEREERDDGDGEEGAVAPGDAPLVVPPPEDPEEAAAPDNEPMASGMTEEGFEPPPPPPQEE